MVGVGVWALLRWLTYILMAMAMVWRRGRDVEEAPSRRSGRQVGSGRVKREGGVQSCPIRISGWCCAVVQSGPTSPQRVEVIQVESTHHVRLIGRARKSADAEGRQCVGGWTRFTVDHW